MTKAPARRPSGRRPAGRSWKRTFAVYGFLVSGLCPQAPKVRFGTTRGNAALRHAEQEGLTRGVIWADGDGVSANASCPRCGASVRPPSLMSSDWRCEEHGAVPPFHVAPHVNHEVLRQVRR